MRPSGSVVLSYRSINGPLPSVCCSRLSSTMAPGIGLQTPRGRFPLLFNLFGRLFLPWEWFFFLKSVISYSLSLASELLSGTVPSLVYQVRSWCGCCAFTCAPHWSWRQLPSNQTWATGNSVQPRSREGPWLIHLPWLFQVYAQQDVLPYTHWNFHPSLATTHGQ